MEHPFDIPELTAGRFTLRPWRLTDLPLVRKASEDDYIPLTTTVPSPYSEPEGIAFTKRQWSRATTRARYTFLITTTDNQPVGQIGLWLKHLEQGRASLGYRVVKSARGQNTATTAVQTAANWALHDLRIPRLELRVEPWNTPSIHTAERARLQHKGTLRRRQVGDEHRDMLVHALRNDQP